MFGIGFPELVLILVVALVVFGPKQLPEVARSIGKGIREVKKMTSDVSEFTDLSKPLDSSKSKIPPNPANPNRPAVPPVIKLEDENGEIQETDAAETKTKITAPAETDKEKALKGTEAKTAAVESTVADAKKLSANPEVNTSDKEKENTPPSQ